jgi:hypothetical protein
MWNAKLCAVERRVSPNPISADRQFAWEHDWCRICGAGAIRIYEWGLLKSFTTTGHPFENCVEAGQPREMPLASIEPSPLTLSDTRGQHG